MLISPENIASQIGARHGDLTATRTADNYVARRVNVRWSLSEFLNIVELRSQTWCFVDLDSASGFSIPYNDAIYCYVMLEGSANITGAQGDVLKLNTGDIVIVLSGEAHALRTAGKCTTANIGFLRFGEYADTPPTFKIGEGSPVTRLLASRLKVRWPGGQQPCALPSVLTLRSSEALVDIPKLLERATGSGAMALLTRAATLLFVSTFREHPECRAAFQEFSRYDPISRARQYIQMHPFDHWTVEILAHKVSLGRSNFATRFAKEVGQTPMEFLLEERMKHAVLFLEKSDMKIAEIARRVGYHSEAAFTRRFRAHFGVPPGELRRRRREAEPG